MSADLANMTPDELACKLQDGIDARREQACSAAVLVPLIPTENGFDVLFEVRAKDLKSQPGEVCVPGGLRESGESALQAAVRETCEELKVNPGQITVIGDMGEVAGLGDFRVHAFVGLVDGYTGTFLSDEVDRVFTMPLTWFLENDPRIYRANQTLEMPDDYPWHLVPGGKSYPFRPLTRETYFYLGTDPLVWGFTARVLCELASALRG